MKDLKPLFDLITQQGCVMMFNFGGEECFWLAQLISDSFKPTDLSDITPIKEADVLALQSLEIGEEYPMWGVMVKRVEDELVGIKLINEDEGYYVGEDDEMYSLNHNNQVP